MRKNKLDIFLNRPFRVYRQFLTGEEVVWHYRLINYGPRICLVKVFLVEYKEGSEKDWVSHMKIKKTYSMLSTIKKDFVALLHDYLNMEIERVDVIVVT